MKIDLKLTGICLMIIFLQSATDAFAGIEPYGPGRTANFSSFTKVGGYVVQGTLATNQLLFYGTRQITFNKDYQVKFSGGYVSEGRLASNANLYYSNSPDRYALFSTSATVKFQSGLLKSGPLLNNTSLTYYQDQWNHRTAFMQSGTVANFAGGFLSSGTLSSSPAVHEGSYVLYYDFINGEIALKGGTGVVFKDGCVNEGTLGVLDYLRYNGTDQAPFSADSYVKFHAWPEAYVANGQLQGAYYYPIRYSPTTNDQAHFVYIKNGYVSFINGYLSTGTTAAGFSQNLLYGPGRTVQIKQNTSLMCDGSGFVWSAISGATQNLLAGPTGPSVTVYIDDYLMFVNGYLELGNQN